VPRRLTYAPRAREGGWSAFYEVDPNAGRDGDAADVRVLRVYGPGQDRAGSTEARVAPALIPLLHGAPARPGCAPRGVSPRAVSYL
jgi:hypothetical protein